MLKQQIAEIGGKAHSFPGEQCAQVLVNGKLRAKADGVVAIDSECRRAEKNLMRLRPSYGGVRLQEQVGTLPHQFTKKPPIPFVRRPAPHLASIMRISAIRHVNTLLF